MKKIYIICVLGLVLSLYACGGGSNSSSHSSNESTKTSTTSSTENIDVNIYSGSKGVGEFNNVDIPNEIDKKMVAKGNEVFQTKCVACHLIGDHNMIGPGLKGITKIRTPEWILNMITNPDGMLSKDPVAKVLLKKFNNVRMTNQGITKEEALQLYEFLRQNDAG